jgi:hypothetical protein
MLARHAREKCQPHSLPGGAVGLILSRSGLRSTFLWPCQKAEARAPTGGAPARIMQGHAHSHKRVGITLTQVSGPWQSGCALVGEGGEGQAALTAWPQVTHCHAMTGEGLPSPGSTSHANSHDLGLPPMQMAAIVLHAPEAPHSVAQRRIDEVLRDVPP